MAALENTSALASEGQAASDSGRFEKTLYATGFICLPLSTLGVLPNIVNILVFLRMDVGDAMTFFLISLAVSDLASILLVAGDLLLVHVLYLEITGALAPSVRLHFVAYLVMSVRNFFLNVSSYITCFLSVMRCLCVLIPLRVRNLVTARGSAVFVCVSLFAASVVLFFSIRIGMRTSGQVYNVSLSSGLEVSRSRPMHFLHTIFAVWANLFSTILIAACLIIFAYKLVEAARFRHKVSGQMACGDENNKPTEHLRDGRSYGCKPPRFNEQPPNCKEEPLPYNKAPPLSNEESPPSNEIVVSLETPAPLNVTTDVGFTNPSRRECLEVPTPEKSPRSAKISTASSPASAESQPMRSVVGRRAKQQEIAQLPDREVRLIKQISLLAMLNTSTTFARLLGAVITFHYREEGVDEFTFLILYIVTLSIEQINASCNTFVYYFFNNSFRSTLRSMLRLD